MPPLRREDIPDDPDNGDILFEVRCGFADNAAWQDRHTAESAALLEHYRPTLIFAARARFIVNTVSRLMVVVVPVATVLGVAWMAR